MEITPARRTVHFMRTALRRTNKSRRRGDVVPEIAMGMFLTALLGLTAMATMGGLRTGSGDRTAQGDVDAAIDAVYSIMTLDGAVSAEPERLAAESGDITWVARDTAPAAAGEVSVAVVSMDDTVGLAAITKSGACWMALVRFSPPIGEAMKVFAVVPEGASNPCSGAAALELRAYATGLSPGGAGSSWRNPVQLGA